MPLVFRLVVFIYVLCAIPAVLISGNPDNSGHFHWHTFWQFELTVPTLISVFILLIGWVISPGSVTRR